MSDTPITGDTLKFLASVVEGTLRGVIAWETTADPSMLVAQLEGTYSLKLESVPDLEGKSPDPDQVLSLLKARNTIFRLDRTDFNSSQIAQVLTGYTSPYGLFYDLWAKAYLKASKISEELTKVNHILEKIVG